MGSRISLKWVLMSLLIGMAMVPVNSQDCGWLTRSDSSYLISIDCESAATVVRLWENNPPDEELFTITDSKVTLGSDCLYASGDPTIHLKDSLDAEDNSGIKTCPMNGGPPTLFFEVNDINERPPYPYGDTLSVMEVTVMENTEAPHEITKIYYYDDDIGETETLEAFLISSEYSDFFTLKDDDVNASRKAFSFTAVKELDFEKQVFYKVEYDISSIDGKGTKRGTLHTFFVYVGDAPDNRPFWSGIVPFYELDECQEEDDLFVVTAQDRDVEVNYNIGYSFTEESEYFDINQDTGQVSKKTAIDREDLLEIGISSFSLAIVATEYKEAGVPGEEPNSNEQVTIITIKDCNDETPEFSNYTYEIEMNEVTDAANQVILSFVVKDMDEGISGTFTLKTDQPDHVIIDPEEGQQTQEVTLTALKGSSLFDYENQKDNPFSIEITATEKKDSSHNSTSTVTITLIDVNDEHPVFLQSTYSANVPEGTALDTYILTIEANDNDVSSGFGSDSIRYSLESPCNEFDVDAETGNVTLKAVLDFEDTTNGNGNLIECTVTARDAYGDGLANTERTKISITITDVVDERPQFVDPGDPVEIPENSEEDFIVGSITVTDADAEASISFDIQKAECTGGSLSTNVSGWFKVLPDAPSQPDFPARVVVGDVEIDREVCKEVTLTIKATDDKTDEEYESESSATESFVITILDEIDEPPIVECKFSCSDISIDEVNEIDPSNASVLVTTLIVTDPDEKDMVYLSLREGDDFVYLSKETVSVQAEKGEEIDIRTKNDANIDCEAQQTIPLEIFVEDSGNYSATIKINITVNDLNDNRPVIDAGLCGGEPMEIKEDDGSAERNGTFLGRITATDKDKQYPHNHVSYMMLNDQYSDSKNTWIPFTIDRETGNVTLLLIDGVKALDREQYTDWELFFRAYDECDESPTCKILQSQPDCLVKITVLDVNDNYPRDLTWLPAGPITVNDFLKQDEDIGYLFTALDDDEGENANLTYFVKGTYRPNSNQNMDLFRAEEDLLSVNPSCRLLANTNFEGQNFTGSYDVILEATDGGNLSTAFNLSINVQDANDETPYFVFGGCAGEPKNNVIKMVENAYTPGENGQPENMEVKCSNPNGNPFTITIQDNDPEPENRRVTVEIDMVNSTVEGLGQGAIEQELLSYWNLYPENCEPHCNLRVSHLIDNEEGNVYNLSLHVRNEATPHKESWDYIRVVVSNENEFDPYFCTNGNCSQVVYMYENDPDVYAYFKKATDEDNNDVSLGDDEYDNVYYYIVGGDKYYFQTVNDYQEKIVLKNMPDGLDREDVEEYTLQIHATNKEGDNENNELPRNDTLNLIIRVGDVNDNVPDFRDDVIFTSFMQSNEVDDRITTIEAIDLDLNETLTYRMLDDLRCFETDFIPATPFTLKKNNDRSVDLILNFDPKGMSQGYCNFTIHVEDSVAHTDETAVKVYVINEDYQVAMYFSNDLEEVQSKKIEIQDIYSSVYNYECTIDSIAQTQSTTGDPLANKTTVYMHFIDEEKNEPVEDKIILDLSDNAEIMTQLLQRLNLIGIHLDSVDTYLPNTNAKGAEEKVKELQILLGVVSLVLGLFVLLLATVYWLRTNKLERKIKVLSTNTFGSKDEGLNQMGLEMAAVPGSNYLAKEHGNHNPVFSESGGLEFKSQDTDSISSGDSVLVGVEDNPEFKSYLAKGTTASSSKGFENPAYGRSIDDVSVGPPGVQGGMKGNPLLNLGGLKDETFGDRDSLGSQDNSSSVDGNINYSF